MARSVTYQEILREGMALGVAEGEARGEARGRAEGEAVALRRSVVALVRTRIGAVPTRLERRLERLDATSLDALFTRLLEAETPAAIRKLLPR